MMGHEALSDSAALPRLGGVLETALYVDNLNRSSDFFAGVLGLVAMFRSDRLVAFDAGRNTVLLLFARGASREDMTGAGGTIPGHDGAGPLHMAFAIAADTYSEWRTRLLDQGVPIRSEVQWPAGGRSLYFEDPDGHVLELATPGLWKNY
jgi:catechol 2,3-dioxygenase-like lactoylglutathione lyase family enzyme